MAQWVRWKTVKKKNSIPQGEIGWVSSFCCHLIEVEVEECKNRSEGGWGGARGKMSNPPEKVGDGASKREPSKKKKRMRGNGHSSRQSSLGPL